MERMARSARAVFEVMDRLGRDLSGSELFLKTIDAIELPITLLQRPHSALEVEFVHANPAFIEMCGYSLEEMVGQRPSLLQGEETDMEAARAFREDVLRTGNALTTLVNYRKDGSAYEVFLLAARLRYEPDPPEEETLFVCCSFLVEEVTMVPPKRSPSSQGGTLH